MAVEGRRWTPLLTFKVDSKRDISSINEYDSLIFILDHPVYIVHIKYAVIKLKWQYYAVLTELMTHCIMLIF